MGNKMTDLEKLKRSFDEIGIHYLIENKECGYVNLWVCNEQSNLQKAKSYGRLFEFCDGEIASY